MRIGPRLRNREQMIRQSLRTARRIEKRRLKNPNFLKEKAS